MLDKLFKKAWSILSFSNKKFDQKLYFSIKFLLTVYAKVICSDKNLLL
jgi:hypothetical protein